MKKGLKYIFVFIIAIMNNQSVCLGQINLDTIVHPWNLIGFDFYPVQISSTETKYYVQDTLTNTFNLYNMDFTPFMTNIAVPEPYQPFVYNYEVIYLSRSLFDCDTSTIEYAYTAIGSGSSGAYKSFYIMRTDGTQLFKLDSARAPYCFGCLNGSQDIRPIINTNAGAKLFLYYPSNTNNLHIYSLCGTLPKMFDFINTNENQSFINIFPNPSSGSLTFEVSLPGNMDEYELVIVENNGKEIKREKIMHDNHRFIIDVSDFNNGIYYYSLCTRSKVYQSGKFILTK